MFSDRKLHEQLYLNVERQRRQKMKRKNPSTAKTSKPKRQKTSGGSLLQQPNTATYGPEKKNIDTSQTITLGIASDNFTVSSLLLGVAQGTTEGNRIGRKTTAKSFLMRWSAQFTATTTLGCNIRYKVVYDKQPNGAAPAVTAILVTDSYFSHNQLSNTDRFITLVDEITPPLAVGTAFSVSGTVYRKLGLETIWASAGGAIANIQTGSFYMIVAQSGFAAVAAPTFQYTARIRYTDV